MSPPLVLNEGSIALLEGLCGRSQLFANAQQVRRRIVCWGEEPPTAVLEPAVVISATLFRAALLTIAKTQLNVSCRAERAPLATLGPGRSEEGWTLCATAAAAPSGSRFERFGARVMLLAEVALSDAADADSCWIETGAEGWVFLAPLGPRRAVLQAALPEAPGGDPAALLAEIAGSTPHIAPLIAEFESAVHVHKIAPAVRHPLVGDSWLALGSTAMALDPICGDGTGHALRGGLLAAAVVTAAEEGGDRTALVGHFERRLLRSFGAHLAACARFYRPGIFGPRWRCEIARAEAAAAAFAPAAKASLEFGLQDLRLLPVRSGRGASDPGHER
jgi:hypothetical protein